MSKLKKYDPQNRVKDKTHEELREYRSHSKQPTQRERAGANRQRFMNLIDEDNLGDDEDFYAQTN